ncbi:MAG: glutathione synthase [Pseudomonadota bacterium]|nr:glutathione synthase [Pseudomonadota bacterium]
MSLTIGVQMDPLETIDTSADSTIALARAAQKRGHKLFHYLPNSLTLSMTEVLARIRALEIRTDEEPIFRLGDETLSSLGSMDVILMRQDPPFNMAYITATHILEHLQPQTLIVNNPAAVRNAPEKLLVTHFAKLMPPTLITSDHLAAKDFRCKHKDVIVKPLFGNGGASVFHIRPGDENFNVLLETLLDSSCEPLIIQRYLPEVRNGDKRILLIDGAPVGAINRVPMAGEVRANMHVGATPKPTDLTSRDQEICDLIGPKLHEEGLLFVGIDVIGDYLTEINVTSPTGIQEYERFTGVDLSHQLWDVIEDRLARQAVS